MAFTTAGRLLASLTVLFGILRVGMGLYAAVKGDQAFVARYIGSGTSGDAIDAGLILLSAGLALGVLTDISRSIRR